MTTDHPPRRRAPLLLASLACLYASGCISLGGGEGPDDPVERLPVASAARCASYSLTFSTTFNDAPDDGDLSTEEHDEERVAIKEAVDERVIQTGLMGFVGQEGLDATRLIIDVRRGLSASILHGIGAGLTLFLVPYWIEVTYEVRGDLYGVDHGHVSSCARDSWYVLVSPFLVFAMPFDDNAQPVALVDGLTRRVLSDLVSQEELRRDGRD